MKKFQLISIFLLCLIHIGWTWQQPKDQEFMQKGYEAWKLGNFNEAILAYENALSLKPRNTDALNFLGVIYEEMSYPQKAEEKYLTAISINRRYLPAYLNLGLLYWNQGDLEKAAYYLNKRVQMGTPKDIWTQKAQAALSSIESKQRSLNSALESSSHIEREQKPVKVKIENKKKLIDQNRLNAINQALDSIHLQESDEQVVQEVQAVQAVSRQEPVDTREEEAEVLFAQGQQLASAQRYQEAIAMYDRVLKIIPGTPRVIKARVDAFLQWKEQATADL